MRISAATAVGTESGSELLDLLDWKRRVFELYATVRVSPDPEAAWRNWRDIRDGLFREHNQSPLPAVARESFAGAPYYDYDPSFRVLADVRPAEPKARAINTSRDGAIAFMHFGVASFTLQGEEHSFELCWLEGYGGGLFLSFTDATSGDETYGGGRYLLDTVKGADLGLEDGLLVLDFNFSYNPSCAYDSKWVCPLAPPENRLPVAVRAGERF